MKFDGGAAKNRFKLKKALVLGTLAIAFGTGIHGGRFAGFAFAESGATSAANEIANAEHPEAAVGEELEKNRLKLEKIRASFGRQRAMFRNLRFKTETAPRPHLVMRNPNRPPTVDNLTVLPEKEDLESMDYQIDRDGRFVLKRQRSLLDKKTGIKTEQGPPLEESFNGETYRSRVSKDSAVIFTPKQSFNVADPLLKPTHFMPHLFSKDIDRVLADSRSVEFSETADGLWLMKYPRTASTSLNAGKDRMYEITFNPKQELMITKWRAMSRVSGGTGYQTEEYRAELSRAEGGFWRPVKCVCEFGKQEPSVLNVVEFELNGPEGDYNLEIPVGSHVDDYARRPDRVSVYKFGERPKTYDEVVQGAGDYIAGFVLDQDGKAVPDVLVTVLGFQNLKSRKVISSENLKSSNATTDDRGRFAIELKGEGDYFLRFESAGHARTILYDVKTGDHDLKVSLSQGGTIASRVVKEVNGAKVPVKGTKVILEEVEKYPFTHLGEIRELGTDDMGQVRFEHVQPLKRDFTTRIEKTWNPVPREWKVSSGGTSKTIQFREGLGVEECELVVITAASSQDAAEGGKQGRLAAKPLKAGEMAPAFEVKTLDGKSWRLTDQRGKAVLLYFWATWCAPCVESMPELKKLHEELSRKYHQFAMISISMDSAEDDYRWRDLVEAHRLAWPQTRIGIGSNLRSNYSVEGAPTYVVIGPDGIIVARTHYKEEIRAAVEKCSAPKLAGSAVQ